MIWKMYSHSLICMQLRFFNLSADCLLIEAGGLPLLSITIGDKVENPVRRNRFFLLVKTSVFSLDS